MGEVADVRTPQERPSKTRLKLASEIWKRTEMMLANYDEAERAAWWEQMEQIRNNKAAAVQGRSLGDGSNGEEKKLAQYMWANFLCAEEVMTQEGVPVQRYMAAYAEG